MVAAGSGELPVVYQMPLKRKCHWATHPMLFPQQKADNSKINKIGQA
jgi:hypothetical protein